MGSTVLAVPSSRDGPGVGHMGLGRIARANVLIDHQISPPNSQPTYTATTLVIIMKRSAEHNLTKS